MLIRLKYLSPKRDVQVNLANPGAAFAQGSVQIGGVFNLNQPQFDEQMAIVPIELTRALFRYNNEVSSLDIKLKDGASAQKTSKFIGQIIGENYLVEDRFEQQKESYRMLQIEKWVTFFILFHPYYCSFQCGWAIVYSYH